MFISKKNKKISPTTLENLLNAAKNMSRRTSPVHSLTHSPAHSEDDEA